MPNLFVYLLKLTISLSIAWLFYRFVLRGLTFYRLNRWYLLGYTLLSFFIPFIDIGPIAADANQSHQPVYIQLIPVVGNYTPAAAGIHPANAGLSPWALAGFVMVIGMALLLIQMVLRMYSLSRIKKQARLLTSDGGVRIYRVDRPITPFSFGNAIFINPRLHTEKEWEEIILHEYVHIRQRHTLDILLAEAVCILNWYNPFAWALRFSIRQNLEFIADRQVLDCGMDKKEYQYHLLTVMGHPRYRLGNNFNFSSLKRRIIMMNKIRSARLHLLRFLFVLPLLAVVFLAFRGRYPKPGRQNGPVFINAAGIVIGLPEEMPLEGVTVRDKGTGLETTTDGKGFFKFRIPVISDSARIHLDFTRPGFEAAMSENFWPNIKTTSGLITVQAMPVSAPHMSSMFIISPGFKKSPANPEYNDALDELNRILTENSQLKNWREQRTEHPEVALFYATEDKQRRLVVHTDGTVERYGYPGTPPPAAMDRKYGVLPWMGPQGANTNRGYLDRWADISAQAEKEFHPAGGTPKAIIFPGDSRVIAVDAAGKATIYDMDNTADPRERLGFERLYGKLPPCVPEKGDAAPVVPPNAQTPAWTLRDTVPDKHAHLDSVLWIVDGVQKEHWTRDSLMPVDQIASIDILKPDEAYRLFGDKGRKGVVSVLTKAYDNGKTPAASADTIPKVSMRHGHRPAFILNANPIYFIDGIRMPDSTNTLQHVNPDAIESITVLKSEAATAQYGPEASSRGVLLITLKKPQKQP
ncbi:MAG TPA: M56 family metallopeptidase [Puia sp.]|uniref:M56 family metallopeptidase n=1 Tax=Puia sp. TaxID=2045100 RepID=UPI002B707674|nr:M56 family metallopeptidase [Puia sp.]HVU93878.1 M56 family metallopeptidase [Puia sp.]